MSWNIGFCSFHFWNSAIWTENWCPGMSRGFQRSPLMSREGIKMSQRPTWTQCFVFTAKHRQLSHMVVEEFDLLSVAQLFCFRLVDSLFSLSRDIITVGTSLRYMAQMCLFLWLNWDACMKNLSLWRKRFKISEAGWADIPRNSYYVYPANLCGFVFTPRNISENRFKLGCWGGLSRGVPQHPSNSGHPPPNYLKPQMFQQPSDPIRETVV